MANELEVKREQLPAHLQEYENKARVGNLDESDRIVPRLQLLQALSPELTQFEEAKPGNFWHNTACVNLGPKVTAIPIVVRKSIVLWAPRGDDRMILARSIDPECTQWDQPNMEFQVKPKGAAQPIIWNTGPNIKKSGLLEFGSSIPGDPRSNPAASLTYHVMWFLVDRLSAAIMINTRSQIKPTQMLFERWADRPGAHYVQQWELQAVQEKGAEGPYFNVAYRAAGYANEELAKVTSTLFHRYEDSDWMPNDESDDSGAKGNGSGATIDADMASKF